MPLKTLPDLVFGNLFTTIAILKAATGPIIIGTDPRSANLGDTYSFSGQIQDVRIYKGVAKYKGGFDVPKPYTPKDIETNRARVSTCKNNFATMSLISTGSQNITLSNGNLTAADSSTSGGQIYSTMGSNTGKWYYEAHVTHCLLYTSPSPRDATLSRMPSSA